MATPDPGHPQEFELTDLGLALTDTRSASPAPNQSPEHRVSDDAAPASSLRRWRRWWRCLERWLAAFPPPGRNAFTIIFMALWMALLVVATVRTINKFKDGNMATGSEHWPNLARTRDYDPCYHGCQHCIDPAYAYRACKRTAAILADDPTIECDGSKIWNWADRYPEACLRARGQEYRQEELRALWYRPDNVIFVFMSAIILMVGGGAMIRRLWQMWTTRMGQRAAASTAAGPGREQRQTRWQRFRRTALYWLTGFRIGTEAKPCDYAQVAYQYYHRDDPSIWAKVHTRLAECETLVQCSADEMKTYGCHVPKDTRFEIGWWTSDDAPNQCMARHCDYEKHFFVTAWDFVDAVEPEMKFCGFSRADPASDPTLERLANPTIEMN
ncbi:hypothetical protein F5Y17DRAFT_430420 [Xylariaceae sp. FL0594]|nr:hypothetical protein F5Y17DRAFT_430420 [Xylariaceae sp. FL0594]